MGGKTATSQQTVSVPPQVLAQYQSVNNRANATANTPFQTYGGEFVAPTTATQNAGIGGTNAAANEAQPYFGAATQGLGAAQAATNPVNAAAESGTAASAAPLTGQQIDQYLSPYLGTVLGSTSALLNQNNQQAQAGQLGNAIRSGAFGGDRTGIAAANLQQQENLANANIYSGIANQGYQSALGTAQGQQQIGLAGAQQLANIGQTAYGEGANTASELAGLGSGAQTAGLQGSQAQIAAGTVQQQTQQAQDTALYNQFLQQQSYPFQVDQFLANIAEGTGALSGSTTTTQQPGGFFSDERLKEDMEPIGKTFDGQPIYRYRMKGDDREQIGLSAQKVERKHPEAVGLAGGYRFVDYGKATEAAANRGHFYSGGVAGPCMHERKAFAYGGGPDDSGLGAVLAAQQNMYAQHGSQGGMNIAGPTASHQLAVASGTPAPPPSGGNKVSQTVGLGKDAYQGYKWLTKPSPSATNTGVATPSPVSGPSPTAAGTTTNFEEGPGTTTTFDAGLDTSANTAGLGAADTSGAAAGAGDAAATGAAGEAAAGAGADAAATAGAGAAAGAAGGAAAETAAAIAAEYAAADAAAVAVMAAKRGGKIREGYEAGGAPYSTDGYQIDIPDEQTSAHLQTAGPLVKQPTGLQTAMKMGDPNEASTLAGGMFSNTALARGGVAARSRFAAGGVSDDSSDGTITNAIGLATPTSTPSFQRKITGITDDWSYRPKAKSWESTFNVKAPEDPYGYIPFAANAYKLDPEDSAVSKPVMDVHKDKPMEFNFVNIRSGYGAQQNKFGLVGTGHAKEVISQASQRAVGALQKFKPPMMLYSAEEPSRARLYEHLTRNLDVDNYKGYRLKVPGDDRMVFAAIRQDNAEKLMERLKSEGIESTPLERTSSRRGFAVGGITGRRGYDDGGGAPTQDDDSTDTAPVIASDADRGAGTVTPAKTGLWNKIKENATAENVIPILTGLAAMGTAPTRSPGVALAAGLGAGAQSYLGTRKSLADTAQEQAKTRGLDISNQLAAMKNQAAKDYLTPGTTPAGTTLGQDAAPGSRPASPTAGATAAQSVDQQYRQKYFVQPWLPDEQAALQKARGAAIALGTDEPVKQAQAVRDQRVLNQTAANQNAAQAEADRLYAMATDPSTDPATQQAALAKYNAVHQWTGDSYVDSGGVKTNSRTGSPAIGVAAQQLSPSSWVSMMNEANRLVDVPQGDGSSVQMPNWRAHGAATPAEYAKQLASAAPAPPQSTAGGPAAPGSTAPPPRRAPVAVTPPPTAPAPSANVSDPYLAKALTDPAYKVKTAPVRPGVTPAPAVLDQQKATVGARTQLLKDSEDATNAGSASLQYLQAAKMIMDSKGKPVVGLYGPAIKEISRVFGGVSASNYQEVAKYLGNAAVQAGRANFPNATQSEVGLQLNELSPSVRMEDSAVNDLLSTNIRSSRYTVDTAKRVKSYLDSGGDPQNFHKWNQQYYPRENLINATKTATGPKGQKLYLVNGQWVQ